MGTSRRRRGSDDGGRMVPLPAKYAVPKKPKKSLKERMFGNFPICTAIFGVLLSVFCAAHLADRYVQAPIKAASFLLGKPLPFEGVLAVNNRLTQAEILLEDQVYGPESMVLDEKTQTLYTGFKSGLIAQIHMEGNKMKIGNAVRLAQGKDLSYCDGSYDTMPMCGRPLGLRMSPAGEVIVADAYLGLFALNFEAEKTVKIIGAGEIPANDKNAPPVKYLNDLDYLPDGRIILTESSTKFDDRQLVYEMFEHRPNGRILIYEPKKKNLRVLVDGLYFPNGIQVSIEKGAAKNAPFRVFFSEMAKTRVMQLWVPRDHYSTDPIQVSPLIEHLPGYPDNIRLTKTGHLLIPIPTLRSYEESEALNTNPRLRELLSKAFSIRLLTFMVSKFVPPYGLVLKVNTETGAVIESYHDETGKVESISIAIDDGKGKMILGSDTNYYIARAKL